MSQPALLKKKKKAIILTEDNAHFQFPALSQVPLRKALWSRMFCWLYRFPWTTLMTCSFGGTLWRHAVFIFSFWCFLSLFAVVPAFGVEAAASNISTYLDPGCVLSLVLQNTVGCIHSRVCSCQRGTLALGRTGCASPAGSPCWHCDPACLLARGYRGGLADLREGRKERIQLSLCSCKWSGASWYSS